MRIFIGVLAAMVIVLAPARGEAETAASEIKAYRDITVTFSGDVSGCNLSDDTMFKQKLHEKLEGAGVRQNDASRVSVNLAVAGKGFGLLGTNCAFSTRLNFLVKLPASNIVTDDQTARLAIDRLGAADVLIYSNGFFGTQQQKQPFDGGRSVAVRDRVLENIDMSVNKLVEDRAP